MDMLITGANRGIGLALATHAARGGAGVLGTYRGPRAPGVSGIEWQGLEVTEPASHRALAERLAGRPLGLVVCNAGIYRDEDDQLETGFPAALWAETLAVNVTGVFLTIQSLLPNIRAAGGKIAIIASQMGSDTKAPGGSYIYRASKAAALNIGRNLATDLRAEGIAVGIYHPGWVRTEMGGAGADISEEEAATGLLARFAHLSPATTGCFECWDGRPHPF
ncbi:SDR family NAD(P)-dependent oxidoreductase [Paragemmobacter straminiformis]|uniref:SDR family NAD(P)-dependent oxidoreductase n=1 Tax=Paragemmobacter straminiformis TaxID=2045119 RepID=A0A842IC97_9RHOB|nr:SDR family NAD(P)-dependent oxidoreductase [Gemmobacter straminiformis]MBC2837196.1 SDR family NAD(P)-dependent oxidoreductase [Gemmobacter straminiformis]